MENKKFYEYKKDDILNLIVNDLREKGIDLTLDQIQTLTNEYGDLLVARKDFESEIPIPPYYDTKNETEIKELLRWSKENKQLIEIVYMKVRRLQPVEETARVVLVTDTDNIHTVTKNYVTLRNGEIEYLDENDNERQFFTHYITRARLTNLI